MQNDPMLKILILAALPEEYAPLRKLIHSPWLLLSRKPFRQFGFSLPGMELRLVETGMGEEVAGKALRWALARSRPELLLFTGFCGGLHPDLHVGDVCIVENAVAFHSHGAEPQGIIKYSFPDELSKFLAEKKVRAITAVTISSPEEKSSLARYIMGRSRNASGKCGESEDSPQKGWGEREDHWPLAGVDMETYALADIVRHEELPFLCFRSVSDELNGELGFNLGDITGPGGRVKVGKVLTTIALHPGTLKAFFVAWRRSLKAGKNLSAVLADFLTHSSLGLSRIARGIRTKCG
jgi:nucleoside phosphorylase